MMLRKTSARLGPLILFAMMTMTGCGSGAKQRSPSAPPVTEAAPGAEPESLPPAAAAADGEGIGMGDPGTLGHGAGSGTGGGYGSGGGRTAKVPVIVAGTVQVRGALDKEVIRRVVRRHLGEVKYCYEKELVRKPDLYGRVMIQFTIAANGTVIASLVQQSTMNNAEVDQCIAGAVRRWAFPKPKGGGVVIVSYPFVLKSSAGGAGE